MLPEYEIERLPDNLQAWVLDVRGISKEKKVEEPSVGELQKAERIKSALKFFRSNLNEWLYHYAWCMSGRFEDSLYSSSRHMLEGEEFKDDTPQLEDIFGIACWDVNGVCIRGTINWDQTQKELMNYPLSVEDLKCYLHLGLQITEKIEGRIREFPSLLNEVSEGTSHIVHLSDLIKSRIAMLEQWEGKHNQGLIYATANSENNGRRINLRTVGVQVLDLLIAIQKDIERFNSPAL